MGVAPACKKGRGSKDPTLTMENELWPDLSAPPQATAQPRLRDAAVVVGIEDYSFVDDIPGAKVNAADWFRFLTTTAGIPPSRVHLLTNYEATKDEIERHVAQAVSEAQAGGRLWFVFIGHGVPAPGGQGAFLVGYDAQRNPQSIAARSIAQPQLVAQLETSAAQSVVVLDACFNGKTASGEKLLGEGLQDLEFAQPSAGHSAIVFTASKHDQYAGPLPGKRRPAFSYLMLGALRGWADQNRDQSVTAQEAVDYTQTVLGTLLKGRQQTPELLDGRGSGELLAAGASEQGPDLAEMAVRGSGATEIEMKTDTVSAPDADLLEVGITPITSIDIDAEQLYDRVMDAQEDAKAPPEKKASEWCALARMKQATNPYRGQALVMCRDWQLYAAALRQKEHDMARDYEVVRKYLVLERKNVDQKLAAIAAFLQSYGDLVHGDYPHVREMAHASAAVKRRGKVELRPLGDHKFGHGGTVVSTKNTPP
jgi:hypothetical protein